MPETFSLFGEPLYKMPIVLWLPTDPEEYEEKIRELKANYEKALSEYSSDPNDPEKLLWLGRRTGILGNFNQAAALYSRGIEKWPEDPRFYRFRGHRFAILRRLDLAMKDFAVAAEIIEGRPDELELYASGGPSKDKMGVSSFNWNVYYHQGFTYFAAGRLEDAADAYWRCMDWADNNESKVATSHWLYMVLSRLRQWEKAESIIAAVETDLELVEVGDYYETLLTYKGMISSEELLIKAREDGPVRFMTRAQAMGNLYQARNEIEKAVKIYKEIHATGRWTGGVHLMAEAELLRLDVKP